LSASFAELLAQGEAALKAGDGEQAIRQFEKALAVSSIRDDQRLTAYQQLGRAYAAHHALSRAAQCYEDAAALARRLGILKPELQALQQASQAHLALALSAPFGAGRQSAFQKAETAARALLDLARRASHRRAERLAWIALGSAQRGRGDYAAAAASVTAAIALAEGDHDLLAAADYLGDLAYTCLLADNRPAAAEHYERGLKLLPSPEAHPALAAHLHQGLAQACLRQGQSENARRHAELAVKLARRAKDVTLEARGHSTLGHALTARGDYEGAAQAHLSAIELLKHAGGGQALLDLAGEWGNVASCYRLIGRHQAALKALGHAIDLSREAGDRLLEAQWQDTLGTVCEELDDLIGAERCHGRALEMFEALGREAEAAVAHNNLGTTLYRRAIRADETAEPRPWFEAAAHHLRRAQAIARRIGAVALGASASGNLGLVLLRTDRAQEAVQLFLEACDALQRAGRALEAGYQLENLGQAYAVHLNDVPLACRYFEAAIETARASGDAETLRIALTRLGEVYRTRLHQAESARQCYTKAINQLEGGEVGRAALSLPAHRAGLLARHLAAYEGLIQLEWEAGDHEAAFNWTERARARAFLEQVGLFAPLPDRGLPGAWLAHERELIREAREQEQRFLHAQDPAAQAGVAEARQTIQERLNRLWDEMARASPAGERYVALRRGSPATADSVQKWLNDRETDSALLACYNLPDVIYVWAFRSRRPIQALPIHLGHGELQRCARSLWRELSDQMNYRRALPGQPQLWKEKLAPLIAEFRPHLEGADRLYLLPHGRLHDFPLHALEANGRIVGDEWAVAYASSAGALLRYVPTPQRNELRALAFGYTPHPDEAEIFDAATQQAARLLNAECYLRDEATSERFKREAPQAGLIYVLCHGEFDERDPLRSRLRLAGEPLTARDLMGLNLPGSMVMLTACQSGMSQVNPGDELVGLSQAFLIAGASAVLAARWTVQAESAIQLVEEFYARWRGEGAAPAVALQQAMRVVRQRRSPKNGEAYTHPFFWAPFTLIGTAG
jgi:CHAT domain-containing protein